MDFVIGFPKTDRGRNLIWIVVDRLDKLAHFILIKIIHPLQKLVEIYINVIVKLQEIPSSIVSDIDMRFTSTFSESLHEGLGTKFSLSYAYHLQTNNQAKRTTQSFEDLLRTCVLEQGGS